MATASPRVDDSFVSEVIATVPAGIVSVDESGTIVFATPAVEEFVGYTADELVEESIGRLFPEEGAAALERIRRSANETPSESESVYTLVNDREKEVLVHLSATETVYDGQPFLTFTLRGIGSEQRHGQAVYENKRRLQAIFEQTSDGIAVYDLERDRVVECNAQLCTLLGHSHAELLSLGPSAVHADRFDEFAEFAARVLEEGSGWTDSLTCTTSAGTVLSTEISASRIDMDGRPYLLASVRDVTERLAYQRQLEALNRASQRFIGAETEAEVADAVVDVVQTVLDRPLTGIWRYDPERELLKPLLTSEEATTLSIDATSGSLEPIRAGTAEMEIFRGGETVLIEEYGAVDDPAHPEMNLEARLVAPLGEYGLVSVGSTRADDFDPALVDLVDVLARTTRTAFDRLDREQTFSEHCAAMDAVTDGIGITDSSGEFTYANESLAALSGLDDPGELLGTSWRRLYGREEVERFESTVLPIVTQRGRWRGRATGTRVDGSTFPQEISLSTLDDGIVCVVRDVTDRVARERQLEALHAFARDLIETDSRAEIAGIAVEAVNDVFGFEVACVRLFDRETLQLDPVAMTDGAVAMLEDRRAYDLEATLAGRAFREKRTVASLAAPDDSGEVPSVEYPCLHVPLGDHGAVSIILGADETVEDRVIHLVELLSVTVGTALSRADRTRLITDHERELRQQRDQLETLNRINTLVRIIEERLVEATTRSELEETICRHLADSELYASAWIGDAEVSADRIVTRAGVGMVDGDLDAIDQMPLSGVGGGTVERAIESRECHVVRQYQLYRDDADGEAESGGRMRATAAVPIVYGRRVYGVLVIHSDKEDVFGDDAVGGLESLGKITGFAISAIKHRNILLTDSIVELEFDVADSQAFFLRLSAELDCTCRFERSVPAKGKRVMCYHTITEAVPAAVLEFAAAADGVESATVIAERDDGFVLQTVTSEALVDDILQAGATLRSAVAEGGTGRVVVEAPQSADVREIVDSVEATFSRVTLRSKRERERSVHTADEFRDAVAERLSEKQLAAIESAYFSGYYDWPREITAEELADSIGISSSTLHQHLRKGTRQLLSAFFTDQSD